MATCLAAPQDHSSTSVFSLIDVGFCPKAKVPSSFLVESGCISMCSLIAGIQIECHMSFRDAQTPGRSHEDSKARNVLQIVAESVDVRQHIVSIQYRS